MTRTASATARAAHTFLLFEAAYVEGASRQLRVEEISVLLAVRACNLGPHRDRTPCHHAVDTAQRQALIPSPIQPRARRLTRISFAS